MSKQRQISILADTSIGMTDTVKERVILIPQYYYFEENKVYSENNGLTKDEFYNKLETKRAYTSGCNPAEAENLFKQELAKGNQIICLAMSSKLSSTYNTLKMVAESLKDEEFPNADIEVIDTKTISLGTSFLVEKIVEFIEDGKEFKEITDNIKDLTEKVQIYFVVDDLKYLARGGRINNSIAKIGDVLNIKPILHVRDGEIEVHSKVRGTKTAIKNLDNIVKKSSIDKIGIVKLNNENLFNELSTKIGVNDYVDLGLVIASHIGPNAISSVFLCK